MILPEAQCVITESCLNSPKIKQQQQQKYSSDKVRYDFFGGDDKLFIDLVVTSIKKFNNADSSLRLNLEAHHPVVFQMKQF